jgi:peptidoglycan/xylan/chitin deacetylase (PgdA/CDA1 family)
MKIVSMSFHFAAGLCLLTLSPILSAQQAANQFQWPEGKRVAVSLSFDDARASQVDVGLPLIDKYGAKVTFFVNSPAVRNKLEGWKKVVASGHEIGNHTRTHPCTVNYNFSSRNALEDLTLERMAEEMDGNNADIEQLLGVKMVTFAFPCGEKFVGRGLDYRSYVPVEAARFLAARGFLDEGPNDPVRGDLAQVTGMVSDAKTFEELKSLTTRAANEHAWLCFAGHDIGTRPGSQVTNVDALEQYLKYAADPANGIWLDTVKSVATYIKAQKKPN